MKSATVLFAIFILVSTCAAQEGDEEEGFCPIDRPEECIENSHDELLPSCFRAAVVEHNRVDFEDVKKTVEANLAIFRNITKLAAENGAKIIVFPEDGLFIAKVREKVFDVLTEIPDPTLLEERNKNPCLDAPDAETSYILRDFSCMARENNIYLVANFGTKQACQSGTKLYDLVCPDEGFFSFNTDVVFDPEGSFLRRYRKYNTFDEIFHQAPSLETVYFDTPYGRFGVFTCFDLIFKRPAVDLVEKFQIDTAIFPTWWYDELPLLSAIQYQDGWSWTNQVNLLAANIQRRNLGSTGSGIFSHNQTFYTGAGSTNSKLILANLPAGKSRKCDQDFQAAIIDITTEQDTSDYIYKHYDLLDTDSIYVLEDLQKVHTLCSGGLCCTFDYKIESEVGKELLSKLVLIARDSLRPGRYEWYEQVCTMATLEKPFDKEHHLNTRFSSESNVKFERISIKGRFKTKYVYPIAAHSVSKLVSRDDRHFECDKTDENQSDCSLELSHAKKGYSVYSFGMYARLYDNDKVKR